MLTIQNVIDQLRSSIPPIEHTVDRLMTGNPQTVVRGIATTFMATQQMIEQAISCGVNLIISHEAIYYSHRMIDGLLADDPVYLYKMNRIQQAGIAVYRHHDYCHHSVPDPIMKGLLQSLELEAYVERMLPTAAVLRIPEISVLELAENIKSRLSLPYVRMTGDPRMTCRRIGVLVGYRGGAANAIPLFREERVDLIIAGEGPEWETPEYVRDAASQGMAKSLLIMGHAESEEPGMCYLAESLRAIYPGLPVHFFPIQPLFQVI